MWFFAPDTFVSIVHKDGDHLDLLTVRARRASHLAAFVARGYGLSKREVLGQIKLNVATDYPFREQMSRDEVARALLSYVEQLTYSNFKDEVSRVGGKAYAHVLGRVWTAALSLETAEVRKALEKRWSSPKAKR